MDQSQHVDRPQFLGEEIANSISHGVGFLAAVAVTPLLIIKAIPSGTSAVVGVSVFGATMMILYMASTLYHAFPESRTKRIFRIFDHGAIFLLIAGTYTPFTLTVLYGAWGWTLFGIVWALAAGGVVLKSVQNVKPTNYPLHFIWAWDGSPYWLLNPYIPVYLSGGYFG